MSTFTAVVKQDGDWWIGWVEEVSGVNAQESTREGLLVSLKVVLQEAPTSSLRWPCEAPRFIAPSQPAMLVDIDDEELFFVSEREARQRQVPSRSNSRLLSSDAI